VLAALVARGRTGEGARIRHLDDARLTQAPARAPVLTMVRLLRDVCVRGRPLADRRSAQPKFFTRICELVGRPELADGNTTLTSRRSKPRSPQFSPSGRWALGSRMLTVKTLRGRSTPAEAR